MATWADYWKRFWPQFRRDWGEAVKTQLLVGVGLSALTIWLQVRSGLITRPTINVNTFDVMWPYLLFAGGFAVYHAASTVKKIHDEDQAEIARLTAQVETER